MIVRFTRPPGLFGTRAGSWLIVGITVCCWLFGGGGQATAQDPEVGLAEAEEHAASASAEIPELEASLRRVKVRLVAIRKDAAPIRSELRAATGHVTAIKRSLRRRHQRAVAAVQRADKERAEAHEGHDETVRSGIGSGIAALVVAVIAFTWGWFRASTAVAALARMELGQAVGLCVGGGLLAVIVGGAMSSINGILGAIGYALLALGFVLPIAFVLARHSAEVQRGGARAYLRHQRLPARATQGVAGLFAAVFLLCLGSAVFAGEAKSGDVNAQLRAQAKSEVSSDPALAAAEAKASGLARQSAAILAVAHGRRAELIAAKHRLGRARTRLVDAEQDGRHFTRRLAALAERERREQRREERRAQRQAEAEESEAAGAQAPADAACDPNYEGACLHEGKGDYDCKGGSGDGPNYAPGPIYVVGVDEFGLDSDGDGVACEDG